jgi:hypothetical protein
VLFHIRNKHQIPSTKSQIIANDPNPNFSTKPVSSSKIGALNLFGICDLEFVI